MADAAVGDVRIELDRGVATVSLDRPPRNALTGAYCDAIVGALRSCDKHLEVRAVVLTGIGAAFCAGADLESGPGAVRGLFEHDGGTARRDSSSHYVEPASRITLAMDELRVPVVAAINGDAVGGGATMLLAADLRFCAENARFAFPFTRLGLCPEGGSTFRLPQLVGQGHSADWLLSGRLVGAREALAAGLVSRVLPPDQVVPAAKAWALDVADRCAPAAVAITRELLRDRSTDQSAAAGRESRAIVALSRLPDCLEGVSAFLERRDPRFSDPTRR